MPSNKRRAAGIGLIEILIALVIIGCFYYLFTKAYLKQAAVAGGGRPDTAIKSTGNKIADINKQSSESWDAVGVSK